MSKQTVYVCDNCNRQLRETDIVCSIKVNTVQVGQWPTVDLCDICSQLSVEEIVQRAKNEQRRRRKREKEAEEDE